MKPNGKKTPARLPLGKRPLGPFAGAAQQPRNPLLIPFAPGAASFSSMVAMRAVADMVLVNQINQMPPDQRGEAVADMHQKMLESRIINAGEMSPEDAICYATIYHALYPIESQGKIDVTSVKEFVDEVVRKDPSVYESFQNYFGLDGTSNSIVHVETMQKQFTERIQPNIRRFRTFKNAMIYNPDIKKAVHIIASKVRTSRKNVSELDKALAAFMLYFVLLKDIWYFWLDIDSASQAVTMDKFHQTNERTFYPENIIPLANNFFAKLPDEDILYDVIIDFIDSYPKNIRKMVYRFAQMDGSEFAEHWTYGRIRREIKGALFPNFCSIAMTNVLTISGLQTIDVGSFKNAYYAAKKGYHKLPICEPTKIANALGTTSPIGYVMIHKRQFGIAHIDGEDCPQYVCSEQELGLNRILYEYLQKNPSIRIGTEKKNFTELHMLDWSITIGDVILKWVLDSQFAACESDVNWDLIPNAVNMDSIPIGALFMEYFHNRISKEEVLTRLGFSSSTDERVLTLAKMVFSRSAATMFTENYKEYAVLDEHPTVPKYELSLYRSVFNWIRNNLDMDVGFDGSRTLRQEGMSALFFNKEEAMTSVILTLGLAANEEDINWKLAYAIMEKAYGAKPRNGESPASTSEVLQKYNIGAISANSVMEHLGFAQEVMEANPRILALARMCFSYSGLKLFEPVEMRNALRNHKRFRGAVSNTDKLYYELYLFLAETNTPCGGVGAAIEGVEKGSGIAKTISAYGIQY